MLSPLFQAWGDLTWDVVVYLCIFDMCLLMDYFGIHLLEFCLPQIQASLVIAFQAEDWF